jgi:hypothetical protein
MSRYPNLGRFLPLVADHVDRFNQIRWMSNAGSPTRSYGGVVFVNSLESARIEYQSLVKLSTTIWKSYDAIANELCISDLFSYSEDYFINHFSPEPQYLEWTSRRLFDAILSDLKGCLREVILDEIIHATFFRDSVKWYELGHWRCGIDKFGRRSVW